MPLFYSGLEILRLLTKRSTQLFLNHPLFETEATVNQKELSRNKIGIVRCKE
jgi:hypothetical protein